MAETTNIEWCDATFNPWIGCNKISPACDDCYAARSTPARTLGVVWGPHEPRRRTSESNWALPKRWEAQHEAFAAQHGRRRRVFCASLADVFDNAVPQEWRDDLFELIRATPNLDWLLLTKRIGNVGNMLPVPFDFERIYPNVWLGITVCNQAEANRDIPKLLKLDASVRFLSVEPMLGPIDLQRACTVCCANRGHCFPGAAGERLVVDSESGGYTVECICSRLNGLHWVICGGESGPQSRPMHPDWARSLRDQCEAASAPFLFKQWGEWTPGENVDRTQGVVETAEWFDDRWLMGRENLARDDGHIDDQPDLYRVGKQHAGRRLDGVEHNGFPEIRR